VTFLKGQLHEDWFRSEIDVGLEFPRPAVKEINKQRNQFVNVEGAQCPLCHNVVVSRWQHDFRVCGCGATAIDGGQEYSRLVWTQPHTPIDVTVAVDSLEELRATPGVWPAYSTEPRRYRLHDGHLLPE